MRKLSAYRVPAKVHTACQRRCIQRASEYSDCSWTVSLFSGRCLHVPGPHPVAESLQDSERGEAPQFSVSERPRYIKSDAGLPTGRSITLALLLIARGRLSLTEVTAANWTLILVIGATTGSGALFLYYFGLTRVRAGIAAICEMCLPLSAILFDYLRMSRPFEEAWDRIRGSARRFCFPASDMAARVFPKTSARW